MKLNEAYVTVSTDYVVFDSGVLKELKIDYYEKKRGQI